METVVLRYKRENIDRAVGEILLEGDDPAELVAFAGLEWESMMLEFADALIRHPQAQGAIQRTDKEGLKPFMLGEFDLARFRKDPKDAIRSMTYHVESHATPVGKSANVMQPLPAAISVLVETFGDVLYLRAKTEPSGIFAMSPWSAEWVPVENSHISYPGGMILLCNTDFVPQGWVGVPSIDLLLKGFERYYLPREWNKHGEWITWEQLNQLFSEFETDREKAK